MTHEPLTMVRNDMERKTLAMMTSYHPCQLGFDFLFFYNKTCLMLIMCNTFFIPSPLALS